MEEAAGQEVMHYHCQVISRYAGDVKEPGGGVRGSCRRGRSIPNSRWILGYNDNGAFDGTVTARK